MNAMPFRSASTRRASSATQSEIAIGRVLADMGSADQLAHADPALRVACPVCEALSHQRCLERNPKQYVTPHAERAALLTSAADRTTLIPANQATPPLADELQRIADYEGGRRTTAPRVIQSAGRTQAFAAGGEPGKMRAGDADRDRVVERLNIAYSEGRLSKDEHDGRLENALSARTYADLDQLVTDLPAARATAVTSVAKTNGLALASLICGLAPFIFGPPAAIPAIVFGHVARHQIKRTGEQGAGLALAGLILGWVTVILVIVLIVAMSVGMHGTTHKN
jgi:Domain of unknown function (DUF1707)/Domain of unknown function (DUF4190)